MNCLIDAAFRGTVPLNRIRKQTATLESWPGAGDRHMKGLKTMCRCSHCTPMPPRASNSRVRRLQIKSICATIEFNRINNIARDVQPSGRVSQHCKGVLSND